MFQCEYIRTICLVLARGSIADPVFSGFFLVAYAGKVYPVGI